MVAQGFVRMANKSIDAKTVVEQRFVSITEISDIAENAGGQPFVRMAKISEDAKTVGGRPFVIMVGRSDIAKNAKGQPSVSMKPEKTNANNVLSNDKELRQKKKKPQNPSRQSPPLLKIHSVYA